MTDIDQQPTQMSHRQILVVLTGLMLGLFLAALDQTIVATALPTIVGEFGGLDHLSWVVTAYLLASTVTSPLYGKISDLYGRKVVFQTAIGLFLVGSILCGFSQNMTQLISFRAVQGLGAGGLIVLALTIIGDVVSPRERGRYQGYFGAVFGLASIAGPLLGGWFVDNLSWRWVFYINLPLGLVALFVTATVLNIPFHRRDHKIDYPGAALLVGGVSSLLLVTVWGGREYEWGSPLILTLAAVGFALIALFLWWEVRTPEPILPLRLFRDRTFALTSAAGFVVGLAMFGGIIFLPLFLQIVVGASATNSGLLLLPMMAGIISMSVISGRLISRTGRYKIYPVIGTVLASLALFLLSTMSLATTLPVASVYMLILGAGLGLVMQVLVLAVQNSVEPRDLGVATSASTFFRSLGGSFGTALFGAIFASQVAANIARNLPGTDLGGTDLTSSPGVIAQLPEGVRAGVIQAFADSTSTVFLAAVPFAVVAFVVVLLLPELPLRDRSHLVGGGADAQSPVGPAIAEGAEGFID
ncbi:MAG TPA: MDR family MFS transporter [Acidimicrobiia bacterium]|nr:MDR family MFS transporter [Acidimicrobiia bacterium]